MKIDKYTKIILTVIAANLTVLTFSNLNVVPSAYAESPESNFAPLNLNSSPSEDDNQKYGLVPLNADGTIDVNVKSISSDMIDVNIQQVGGGNVGYKGPIAVEIE